MTAKELKNGETFNFESEKHDLTVSYGETLGGSKCYRVWFNGKYVLITKKFPTVKEKVEKLCKEYGLKLYDPVYLIDPEDPEDRH
jgi:hypothetical protein